MQGYVVTLFNIDESFTMAQRCVESAKKFNVDVLMFPAVYKDTSFEELKNEGVKMGRWDESYSNPQAVIGNFVSQLRIWKQIASGDKPGIVLEHDAVFVAPIPDLTGKGDIINIGKPSYGRFKEQDKPGVYPMFSKPGGYIPGAHAYYLTPTGAKQLVDAAYKHGANPCDMFLCKQMFPHIKELYPWPVEAHDTFSTIQNKKGCVAKHNYSGSYKLI